MHAWKPWERTQLYRYYEDGAAGLGVETRDGPLVLNDNPNDVGLPLGERKTTEFASPDDERALEETSLLEVLQ